MGRLSHACLLYTTLGVCRTPPLRHHAYDTLTSFLHMLSSHDAWSLALSCHTACVVLSDVSTLFRTQNPIGFQSPLIGQWREIAIRGMAALTVIKHFDVFKHSCLGMRVKLLQINQLGF